MQAQSIRLIFRRGKETGNHAWETELIVGEFGDYDDRASGDARLDPKESVLGLSTLGQAVQDFALNKLSDRAQGLALGRFLRQRLFEDADAVSRLWRNATAARGSRPLRLELVFPPRAGDAALDPDEIPFELLADDSFWFYRRDWVLARAIGTFSAKTCSLKAGQGALLAWANPKLANGRQVAASVFTRHEQVFKDQVTACDLKALPHCGAAVFDHFEKQLETLKPALVSFVGHGLQRGGELLFEGPQGMISGDRFVQPLRAAEAEVAVLWSCHGAQRQTAAGGIAERLLNPAEGDLTAVIAAHAALRADMTPDLAEHLFKALGSEGDLERALSRARVRLSSDDLQWAAPVYYARSKGQPSVQLAARLETLRSVPDVVIESFTVEAPKVADLPPAPGWFQGRQAEIAEVLDLLTHHRLVTVQGMPGIGKTEVTRAAAEQASGFEDALWLKADAASVDHLRTLLGLHLGLERIEHEGQLTAKIGAKPFLLVIDNAEDLVEDETARETLRLWLDRLYRDCPGFKVLASTRRPLLLSPAGDVHEWSMEVPGLEPALARKAFLAAAPRLTEAERASPDLDAVLKLLDGHPRSLVLVAGQSGRDDLTMNAIRRHLEQHTVERVMVTELLGVQVELKETRALRATHLISSLDLSYDRLRRRHPLAADLFCWLGELPGGMAREILEPIFGEDAVLALGTLQREHMVDLSDPRRLRLPAPLRWYAAHRGQELSAERREALFGSTAMALALWLHQKAGILGGFESHQMAAILPSEGDNLASLLARYPSDDSLSLAATFWAEWELYFGRAELALSLLLSATSSDSDSSAQRWALIVRLYTSLGDLELARQACLKVAALLEERPDDDLGWASLSCSLGEIHLRAANLPAAEAAFSKALRFYGLVEDSEGKANALAGLGAVYHHQHRLEEAERAYLAAIQAFGDLGHVLGQANEMRSLGSLYVETLRWEIAEEKLLQALSIYRRIAERVGEGVTLRELGRLSFLKGKTREAFELHRQALTVHLEMNDALGAAGAKGHLGQDVGGVNFLLAAYWCGRAWRDFVRLQSPHGQMLALLDLALALTELNHDDAAMAAWILAWHLGTGYGDIRAKQVGETLSIAVPDFDPTLPLAASEIAQLAHIVGQALDIVEADFAGRGEDPLHPVWPDAPPPGSV